MEIIRDPQEMQGRARQWRGQGLKVVLVPTMGFFHRGHLSLMEYGRTIGDRLVVSLFVNPAQFGPREDLARYPRDLDRDARWPGRSGWTASTPPRPGPCIPRGTRLCGSGVPVPGPVRRLPAGTFPGGGHRGVKLLNQVQPQVAVFGEKDYQQLRW